METVTLALKVPPSFWQVNINTLCCVSGPEDAEPEVELNEKPLGPVVVQLFTCVADHVMVDGSPDRTCMGFAVKVSCGLSTVTPTDDESVEGEYWLGL